MTGLTPAAIDAALSLADAAKDVITTSDHGDLDLAIRTLQEAVTRLDELRRLGGFGALAAASNSDLSRCEDNPASPTHCSQNCSASDSEGDDPSLRTDQLLTHDDLALSVSDLSALLQHTPGDIKVRVALMTDPPAEYAVIGITRLSPLSPAADLNSDSPGSVWLAAAPVA